jgi:CheY-like chemotaxis protein
MGAIEKSLLLLVDDEETNRYTKARVLRHAGFEVVEAGSAGEGLRLLKERSPRLVILDVKLPDMHGWDVCRLIKQDPETSSVLVLQTSRRSSPTPIP